MTGRDRVITIVGMLALIRAAVGGGVDHVTVRIDNRAGLAVQVDVLDPAGDRVGLGEAQYLVAAWVSSVGSR